MPAADLPLEARLWPVMESLARAAVAEICSLVDSQCVEMRLEIRRGQAEIEALRGKLRELREALRSRSLPTASPPSDMSADDEEEEQEKKTSSSGPTNLRENSDQDAPLSSGNNLPQFRPSRILADALDAEDEADARGLDTAAVKVEADRYSVSIGECVFEGSQNDEKLCKGAQGPVMGDSDGQFGRIEDFHPQTHYPAESHQSTSPCKYDALFGDVTEQMRNGEGNPNRLEFKTEPEEEPIAERITELSSCDMMDSSALPWPFLTASNFEAQDCSSRLEQILHASQTDPQLFHLAGTGESLPSCSIKHAVDPRVKQVKARKIQDRNQPRTFKQNSPSWATMLTKVKNLPKASKHKPLLCAFCPKSFNNASDLKRHQRIHTGEKPFGCAVCGKRFALRGNLITHERAHSGSKPFTCQQCGKSFAHGSNLTAHQRVHTGEKPFCCSLCGKTFAWHYPFKRHMALHGQNGPSPGL